jgi:fermentation-respiration switch protein FrsA (DUF1100 family)
MCARSSLAEKISKLKRTLVVFHAPLDQTVGIGNATKIFTAARHPKSFVSLDGADHLLTRHEDAIFVANTLAAFVERVLPAEKMVKQPDAGVSARA